MEESHGAAESGGCARGFVTSSNPSAWPWQRCCTTRTTGCLPQAFFQLYDEEDAELGVRPGSVFDPVPQGWVERHVVEHKIETCLFVQILDAPVPQMGNQVLELLQKIVSSLVEPVQVIEVPKIFPDRVPQRIVERRPPQTEEQLVEVPTIISYSSLQRTVEQTIDIPVPGRGGRNVGLQGFPPGQSSTAHLASLERSSERIVEQIVEIPVSRGFGGGLQDFRPGQGPTASSDFLAYSSVSPGHAGEGVCRTFPQNKKSPNSPASQSSDLLGEVRPWTPAAYGAPMVAEPLTVAELEELGKWVDEFGRWWSRSEVFPGRWVMHDTTDGPVWCDEPGWDFLPVGVQRRWQGGGRRCGCCPALGQGRCLLEAEWDRKAA